MENSTTTEPIRRQAPPKFYTPQAVAERLGVSRSMIYLLLRRGDLSGTWIGRCPRICEADLEAYLERAKAAR